MADLPTGVTFTAATRTIVASGTAALGTVRVTYTAEDMDGDEDSQVFELTVTT